MTDKPLSLVERIAARKALAAEAQEMALAKKAVDLDKPTTILSREWLDNKTQAEVKALSDGQLGKPNAKAVGDYPAGSLKAVACRCTGGSVDGRPGRWEVLYEWAPI